MQIIAILGEILYVAVLLFFVLFALYSYLEKEKRAFRRSFTIALGLTLIYIGLSLPLSPWKTTIFSGMVILFLCLGLGMLFSPRPRQELEIRSKPEPVDERDVIFARFDLQPDSQKYRDYYSRKKEFQAIDEDIRKLPDILSSAHLPKNPVLFSLAEAEFDFLEKLLVHVDGFSGSDKMGGSVETNTHMIKNVIRYLGADICGICELDQSLVYSHVGRGPEPYGQEINLEHTYAIVFAVEMELDMVAAAPQAPVIVETAKQYVEAAKISVIAANMIRHMGYAARAHMAGSNYNAMLTPLAWKAGLGELGRIGIIMTEKYGPRIRLGLVTTDLPLHTDKPRVFGALDFCIKCKKCAKNCPSQAIPQGDRILENGVCRWVLNREECYRYWRKVGTDCARCIFVCPYSKTDNLFHGMIRKFTAGSGLAQTISIWGDDFFYGRNPKARKDIEGFFEKDMANA